MLTTMLHVRAICTSSKSRPISTIRRLFICLFAVVVAVVLASIAREQKYYCARYSFPPSKGINWILCVVLDRAQCKYMWEEIPPQKKDIAIYPASFYFQLMSSNEQRVWFMWNAENKIETENYHEAKELNTMRNIMRSGPFFMFFFTKLLIFRHPPWTVSAGFNCSTISASFIFIKIHSFCVLCRSTIFCWFLLGIVYFTFIVAHIWGPLKKEPTELYTNTEYSIHTVHTFMDYALTWEFFLKWILPVYADSRA